VVPVFSGTCWDDRIDGIIRDHVFILECSFQFQNKDRIPPEFYGSPSVACGMKIDQSYL
jgi:hypothetical protein